nr:synaptobrevin, longin-like domain protein [Tanacetum cinerariifolium]
MVAILEKSEHNVDFYPIVDFVEASPLRIETTEEGTKILATVDGILRTVTKSSLRRNLKLKDEEGISSLPNTELFENLTLMGYNISPNQKFTFQKGQFSHQWKYLIHAIMQCLSPKSTRFNEFSSNIATALVCLATNKTYNFSKMIFDGMGEGSGTSTEPHHTPSPEAQHTSPTTYSSPLLSPVSTAPIPTVTPSDSPHDISENPDLKELAEYENSQSRDHPIFLNDDENHYVQNEDSLEIAISNPNEEKEEPPQDSDIHHLIEECRTKVSEEKKQSMEDTMLELEVKNVVEQPAEHGNHSIQSLQNFRVVHKSSISFKNTSRISSIHAVAPILSIKEPEYSSSMRYENPNTTLEIESDEIIKSGVEELVPNLSECEVTLEDKRECDVPISENSPICDDHSKTFSDSKDDDDISVYNDDFEDIEYVEASLSDPEIVSVEEENGVEEENVVQHEEEEVDLEDISQIQDVVLRKKLLSTTRLISNIKSLNDSPTPDRVLNSFESDNSLSDNFSPEFETFCDHMEETRSDNTTTHADNSLPEYDSFCFEIEPDQERLINLVKNDISDDSSNDPLLKEADLFLASDNSIPPGIENVADDSEGDIHAETNAGEEIPVVMNDKDKFDEDYYFFMFDKVFSLLSAESEDTIFDPAENPERQYTRRARIAQSSALPPVANEHASPLRDVSQGEACPTVSSLDAEQLEMVSRFEAQELEINSLKARIKLLEDKDRGVAEHFGDDAPIKRRRLDVREEAVERVSNDTSEMETVLTSMDAATVLSSGVTEVPTGSGSIPTAGPPATEVPTGSDVVPTAGPNFATATVVTPYTRRKGKETMVESETPKKKKVQEQIDAQVARELEEQLAREDQRMSKQIARDVEIARIHAEEELQIMIDGLNKSWKVKDFRGITFEEIEAMFTTVWKQIKNFIPMGSKEEAERFKRKGIRFEQESVKKLKTSEEVHKEVKTPDEAPEEKVKDMMRTEKLLEDYKAGRQLSQLPILYGLIEAFGQGGFEPVMGLNDEDQLWTHTQNLMHAPVEWKLYDTCGVHHVTFKDKEIFMLVEKDYPLRKGLAIVMICYKLQVENYSQMASDLVLKIHKIANCPRQEDD